jgi:hypothetical protein
MRKKNKEERDFLLKAMQRDAKEQNVKNIG